MEKKKKKKKKKSNQKCLPRISAEVDKASLKRKKFQSNPTHLIAMNKNRNNSVYMKRIGKKDDRAN